MTGSGSKPGQPITPIRRLGVIGDVHAEHNRLGLALDYLQAAGVDQIICTGDIVDGRGCPETAVHLLQQHQVATVRGNHDRWLLADQVRHVPHAHARQDLGAQTLTYLDSLPSVMALDTVAGKLMLCHGMGDNDLQKIWPGTARMPAERSQVLDQLIDTGHYRYIINGHMHFRTIMHFEALTLINAGTLKGEQWPGFMLIDFASDCLTSLRLTDEQVDVAREVSLQPGDQQTLWRNTRSFAGLWQPQLLH